MNSSTRACIAYIAGTLVTEQRRSGVYDYSQSKHINISGSVDGENVAIFDHDRGCHISGCMPNLYDYGNSAHVQLTVEGRTLKGFDYGSSRHFSGSISGNSVQIFDYEQSAYFTYGL